jgi:hypothetical protein
MADKHDVRKGVEIVFADGLSRTVRPLTIKSLRKFVKVMENMRDIEDFTTISDEDIDQMMKAAAIILEKIDPQLVADEDALEEALDVQCFAQLMSVAMGASSPEE